MKFTNISVLFFTMFSMLPAQSRLVTKSDLNKMHSEIEKEVKEWKEKESMKSYLSDYSKNLALEFMADTLRIESLFRRKLDIDYTTAGMVNAAIELESGYDGLLNKYYNLLMKKLNSSDKEIMKRSQLNWIKFRDSEKRVNEMLAKEEYSGGGTMQNIIIADKNSQITKGRVNELFEYLYRFYE